VIVIDGGQAAAPAAVTCRAPEDPARREWSLVREGPPDSARWRLVFRSAELDRPSVSLPLPGARPEVGAEAISLQYRTANGGRSVELSATDGPSSLDVFVSYELEVNVERDLDREVDRMNTGGTLAVVCERASGVGASVPQGEGASSPPGLEAEHSPRVGEWMVGAGYGWSIDLLRAKSGRHYLVTTASWGHDVMSDAGPGILRGRLAWAFEAMPVYWQLEPTSTWGVGVLPLVWRWRFVPRARGQAFAELAFGGLFTRAGVPEGTESANFLAHGAFGVRWNPAARTSLVTAYRFHHISNGNQLTSNPGVNAHVIWIGISRRGEGFRRP
jgi:hypothetical protein